MLWDFRNSANKCFRIALHCIALYCTVLYCTVLYCIVLYCIVLYCIVLYCIALHCIVLYCIVLYCIVLYCMTLHRARSDTIALTQATVSLVVYDRISTCVRRKLTDTAVVQCQIHRNKYPVAPNINYYYGPNQCWWYFVFCNCNVVSLW